MNWNRSGGLNTTLIIQLFWVAGDKLDLVPPESTQIHGSSLDYKCTQDNLGISSVSPSHSKLSISDSIQAPFGWVLVLQTFDAPFVFHRSFETPVHTPHFQGSTGNSHQDHVQYDKLMVDHDMCPVTNG